MTKDEALKVAQLRFRTPALKDRVKVALAQAAYSVVSEAANVSNHAKRILWAADVLGSPGGLEMHAERVMWLVCLDPTLMSDGEGVQQSVIEGVIAGSINSILIRGY